MHAAPRAARSIALLTHPPPSPAQEAEPRRSQRAVRPEQAPPSPAPPDDAAGADQSHTCQSTEKRKRDEGAKLAPTFSQIKRARRAQSRAGRPGQCRGRAPRAWPRREARRGSRSCVQLTHSLLLRPIAYHTRVPPPSQERRRAGHRGGRRPALPLQAVGDRCAGARELPPPEQPHEPTPHSSLHSHTLHPHTPAPAHLCTPPGTPPHICCFATTPTPNRTPCPFPPAP